MRLPPLYALVCLIVLGGFAYTKYLGLALFSATGIQASSSGSGSSGSSGGRSSGGFSGSHK